MLRILLALALIGIALGTEPGFAQQKKKGAVNCSYDQCVSACNNRGGQPRLCPTYCMNQMRERKAAGQCK